MVTSYKPAPVYATPKPVATHTSNTELRQGIARWCEAWADWAAADHTIPTLSLFADQARTLMEHADFLTRVARSKDQQDQATQLGYTAENLYEAAVDAAFAIDPAAVVIVGDVVATVPQFTAAAVAEVAPAPVVESDPTTAPVPTGLYTVVRSDDTWATYRFRDWDRGDQGKTRVVSLLTGPNNEADYKVVVAYMDPTTGRLRWAKDFAKSDLAIIMAGPQGAGQEYARRSGNCYRCNRTLTTPESIASGIGPTCAGRE